MKAVHAIVVILLGAAVTLTSVAAASPDAAKQRVAITSSGTENAHEYRFVLTPLQEGTLERDSGSGSAVFSSREIVREGQSVTIDSGVETLDGKQGTLTVRFRIEWVPAGNDQYVGTGTWKVIRGTGAYSKVTGGGRGGHRFLDRGAGPWSSRDEGFLTAP